MLQNLVVDPEAVVADPEPIPAGLTLFTPKNLNVPATENDYNGKSHSSVEYDRRHVSQHKCERFGG
jgi:hypothetical protein